MLSRKILFIAFVCVLATNYFLFTTSSVFAQSGPFGVPSADLLIYCLKADKVDDVGEILSLSGTRLDPLKRAEIWREFNGDYACAIDKNGASTCGAGAVTVGPNFQILSLTRDQVKPNANQELKIARVRSGGGRGTEYVPYHEGPQGWKENSTPHVFYAVQQTGTTELAANSVALKLKNFAVKAGKETHCTTISWTETRRMFDPYGRVFDAISLEPITDASVALFDSQKRQIPNRPGVINPQLVNEGAWYVFLVPDGTYYLEAQRAGFTFPVDAGTVSRIASSQGIYSDIYGGEAVIQQNGIIQHRDIPMMPVNPLQPTNTRPTIPYKKITRYQIGPKVYNLIFGQTSHPFSYIHATSGLKEIGKVQADKLGNFEMSLVNDQLDAQLPVELVAEKVPLTSIRTTMQKTPWWNVFSSVPVVSAEENTQFSFPEKMYPLPNYINGKVSVSAGKIPPGTMVQLSVPGMMGNRVASSAVVKEDGTISIPSTAVPPLEFEMKVIDKAGNELKKYTPHEFVAENRGYLKEKKVNLLAVQKTAADYTSPTVAPLVNSAVMPTGVLNTNKSEIRNTKSETNSKSPIINGNTTQQFTNKKLAVNSGGLNSVATNSAPSSPLFGLFMLIGFIGIVVVGGIVIVKKRSR